MAGGGSSGAFGRDGASIALGGGILAAGKPIPYEFKNCRYEDTLVNFCRESVHGLEPKLVAPASLRPEGVFKNSGPPLSPEQVAAVAVPFAHSNVALKICISAGKLFEQALRDKSVNEVSRATEDAAPSLDVCPKPEAITEEKESE